MTLTLELTPDREAKLQERARALGVDPAELLLRLIDDLPKHPDGPRPGESLLDGLKRIGVVGVVKGRPRPDGKAWSQCEDFE
jgi:hypothetical protein